MPRTCTCSLKPAYTAYGARWNRHAAPTIASLRAAAAPSRRKQLQDHRGPDPEARVGGGDRRRARRSTCSAYDALGHASRQRRYSGVYEFVQLRTGNASSPAARSSEPRRRGTRRRPRSSATPRPRLIGGQHAHRQRPGVFQPRYFTTVPIDFSLHTPVANCQPRGLRGVDRSPAPSCAEQPCAACRCARPRGARTPREPTPSRPR